MITRINQALDASRLKREENEKGFTLIELLVVVIIIGILAAIAIPVFLNQRQTAWRASVESDLKNAALAVETFSTQNNGSLAGIAVGSLTATTDPAVNVSGNNVVTLALVGTTGYTITGTSTDLPGESLVYSSAAGGLGDWLP